MKRKNPTTKKRKRFPLSMFLMLGLLVFNSALSFGISPDPETGVMYVIPDKVPDSIGTESQIFTRFVR